MCCLVKDISSYMEQPIIIYLLLVIKLLEPEVTLRQGKFFQVLLPENSGSVWILT